MNDAVMMGAALLALKAKEGHVMDEAAFEVRTEDGHLFRVFASGEIDGFPPGSTIVNRIPKIAAAAVSAERRKHLDD